MIKNKLARKVFGCTFVTTLLLPAVAMAAEEGAKTGGEWQASVGKALGAGLAMGVSALSAGYAQAKIGSAGAGTLAERPEVAIWVIVLQALPEVIVLLGFVSAILIKG
jgi:V/A-type H+-transporting ATPase subunit K